GGGKGRGGGRQVAGTAGSRIRKGRHLNSLSCDFLILPKLSEARRSRQESTLDLSLGLVGEFVAAEIACNFALGLTLARDHHCAHKSPEKPEAIASWSFGGEAAFSDGERGKGH